MSAISQLLLAQLWSNFKYRFLRPSWTDSNCHGDIRPGNICPGNICPYQEYLGCYWSNIDKKFLSQCFGGLNCFGPKSCLTLTFLDPKIFWTKIIWTQHFLIKEFFLTYRNSLGHKKTFGCKIMFDFDFLILIFDTLLNNLIQLTNLPNSMEILGN